MSAATSASLVEPAAGRPARRGNARRRDWALCRLDRQAAYRLTFDRLTYRWEVEELPADEGVPAGPEQSASARGDGPSGAAVAPAGTEGAPTRLGPAGAGSVPLLHGLLGDA